MSWKPNQDLKSFDKVPSVSSQASGPPNVEHFNDNLNSKKREKNRSKDVRRDTDVVKDFTITLEDVDETILTHLNELKMSVLNEGKTVEVPVVYASPERWKSIQVDGALRDHKGQLQLPALAVKRGGLQRNESLRIFNRYNEHLSMPFIRKYSQKNAYDRFSVTNCLGIQHQPVHEVHNVNLPDHYLIQYPCIVWTDRIDQNNKIVERIAYSSEDYWGSKRYFKFRTTISDFDLQTDIQDGNNRMVRSTFNIQVYAYLLPEYHKDWEKTTQKSLTPRKIFWGVEIEPSKELFDEHYELPFQASSIQWPISGSS